MAELENDIQSFIDTPKENGSDSEVIDSYSKQAREIIHQSLEWQKAKKVLNVEDNFHPEPRQEKIIVLDKKFELEDREGYLSNECYALIKVGKGLKSAIVKIEDEPITQEFDGGTTAYKGGIWFDRRGLTPEELKNEAQEKKISYLEMTLDETSSDEASLQALVTLCQGYISNRERFMECVTEQGKETKKFAIDSMKRHQTDTDLRDVQRDLGLLFNDPDGYSMSKVGAINLILRGHEIGGYGWSQDTRFIIHNPFDSLARIFAASDSVKQEELYNLALIHDRLDVKTKNVPASKLMKGARIAEVGGNFVSDFSSYGAEVICPERHIDPGEFGGIKNNETQITLANYETEYPGLFDFSMSRNVMDGLSGIGTGFSSDLAGSIDLLTVFANITKEGGITMHQGGAVPNDTELLNFLGLECVYTYKTQSDPIRVFHKVDDRKITKHDLEEFLNHRRRGNVSS
jgi:hypothetical protein